MATSTSRKPHSNTSSGRSNLKKDDKGPYDYLFDNDMIQLVNTEEHCNRIVERLIRESSKYKALGLDCEWVQHGKKRNKVSLIQLSSFDGLCGVFQMSRMKIIPKSLKDLLENEEVYKVGVATDNDARLLKQDYSVDTKPFLDVRHLTKHFGGFNIPHVPGLASLSEYVLNKKMDKDKRVSRSNWDKKNLDKKQINYAAIDAHVGIKVFAELVDRYGDKNIYDIIKGYADKTHDDKMRCLRIDGIPEMEDENLNEIFKNILKILQVDTSELFYMWFNRLGVHKENMTRAIAVNYVGAKIGSDILDKYDIFNEEHPNDELNSTHLGFVESKPILISKSIPYLDISLHILGIPYRKNENLTEIFMRILEKITFPTKRVHILKCTRNNKLVVVKLSNVDYVDKIIEKFLNFNRNSTSELSSAHLGLDGASKITLNKSVMKKKKNNKQGQRNPKNAVQRNNSVSDNNVHSSLLRPGVQNISNNNYQGNRSNMNKKRSAPRFSKVRQLVEGGTVDIDSVSKSQFTKHSDSTRQCSQSTFYCSCN